MRMIGLLLVGLPMAAPAQKLRKADKLVAATLQKDMEELRGDSSGYQKVSELFGQLGLTPGGENGKYLAAIELDRGVQMDTGTQLSLDGSALQPGTDFFVLAGSPDGRAEGTCGISLNERGLPWIYDLRYDLEGGRGNPRFSLRTVLVDKAKEAQRKGAKALILYNSSNLVDGLTFDTSERRKLFPIPVLYVGRKVSSRSFRDATADVDVRLQVRLDERIDRFEQVLGEVGGHGPSTLLICAHEGRPAAEAGLVELARLLEKEQKRQYNFQIAVMPNIPEVLVLPHEPAPADSVGVIDMDNIGGMDSLMNAHSPLAAFLSFRGAGEEVTDSASVGPDTGREALLVRYLYKMLTERR